MKIGIFQQDTWFGDFQNQINQIIEADKKFVKEGAELAIYPPTVFGPLAGEPLLVHPTYKYDLATAMARIAASISTPTILPTLCAAGDESQPELLYFKDGTFVPVRMQAFAQFLRDMPDEPPEHAPFPVLNVGGRSFSFVIDQRQMTQFFSEYKREKNEPAIDALVYLPFDSFNKTDCLTAGAAGLKDAKVCQWAQQADTWVLCVNGVGGFEDQVFCGGSYCVTPWGEVQDAFPVFDSERKVIDVDFGAEGPLENPVHLEKDYEQDVFTYPALVLATSDYILKSGFEGATFVMTGDLATSLLAVHLVDALGPKKVVAVLAPGAAGDTKQRLAGLRAATKIAEALHITYQSVYDSTDKDIGETFYTRQAARVLALSIAEECNFASVTANDKTAFALGQDLDGWRSCQWAPFSDVYRTTLRIMADSRNNLNAIIPSQSLKMLCAPVVPDENDAPLSLAGIKGSPEQFDGALVAHNVSRQNPLTSNKARYLEAIDFTLFHLVDLGEPLARLEALDADISLSNSVASQLYATEKYRVPMPLGAIVSPLSLRERGFLATAAWTDHFAADEKEQELILNRGTSGDEELMERIFGILDDEDLEEAMEMKAQLREGGLSFGEGDASQISQAALEDVKRKLKELFQDDQEKIDDVLETLGSLHDAFSTGMMDSENGEDLFNQGLFSNN